MLAEIFKIIEQFQRSQEDASGARVPRELQRSNIIIEKELGRGAFGVVFKVGRVAFLGGVVGKGLKTILLVRRGERARPLDSSGVVWCGVKDVRALATKLCPGLRV